eukprot:scaffold603_cov404-Prasinococcus_capsulatus_cf.AAC.51
MSAPTLGAALPHHITQPRAPRVSSAWSAQYNICVAGARSSRVAGAGADRAFVPRACASALRGWRSGGRRSSREATDRQATQAPQAPDRPRGESDTGVDAIRSRTGTDKGEDDVAARTAQAPAGIDAGSTPGLAGHKWQGG